MLYKEKKRNRILQSFMAGAIKSISNYISPTDMTDNSLATDIINSHEKNFPIPYLKIFENIKVELEKDNDFKSYCNWLKNDRNLFYDKKYRNDGFNMLYWDFFDYVLNVNLRDQNEK